MERGRHVQARAGAGDRSGASPGSSELRRDFGPLLVEVDLTPVGAPRRNWKQTLISDGYVIVRHPDLKTLLAMADRVARELQLYAS